MVDLVEEMKKEEEVFFFQSGGGIRRLGRVSWVGGGVKGTFPNPNGSNAIGKVFKNKLYTRLLYTSDAADEEDSVVLGGRRIIKKKQKKNNNNHNNHMTAIYFICPFTHAPYNSTRLLHPLTSLTT